MITKRGSCFCEKYMLLTLVLTCYFFQMVRCALQVRQKQDAYNILWRTTDKQLCSGRLLDPFFRNDELEYFTADARNFVVTGLCVSFTDLPKPTQENNN